MRNGFGCACKEHDGNFGCIDGNVRAMRRLRLERSDLVAALRAVADSRHERCDHVGWFSDCTQPACADVRRKLKHYSKGVR